MKTKVRTSILWLLITSAFSSAQPPSDGARPTVLDEVIVTASREPETVFETPYTAHVIGHERFIGERLVRSLPDALAETPGVLVQKTGYGQASPF